MKRLSTIIMALVLALGLTQCKKNEPTANNQGETYNITLSVGGASSSANKGEKVEVNPITGSVDFETGDQIYVASAGKYVGTLTYDGTVFAGAIGNATEGQPLQFYFLGNVTPAETLSIGTSESCSVVISDQTQHLPVISAAPSVENFYGEVTDYTAELLNKCALVKFNVTTSSTAPTCVTGFNNKVTVSFMDNTFTNSQEGEGVITLPAGSGEKWAILLPQNSTTGGEAYAASQSHIGTYGAVPAIYANGYFPAGIPVEVTTAQLPQGIINSLFTINASGDQVYFSQGNLQYQPSTSTWRFALNQYDTGDEEERQYYIYQGGNEPFSMGSYVSVTLEEYNAYIAQGGDRYYMDVSSQYTSSFTGWIDLFGWGTSGYNHGASAYQPWSTSGSGTEYWAYGVNSYNLYDQTRQADWGYNAISNGGNTENRWRTLTNDEWGYVFNSRTDAASKKGHGKVNDVNGMILLPDDWTLPEGLNFTPGNSSWTNVYNAEQWAQMEANGAVFLPAAGKREGTRLDAVDSNGIYWSSSYYNNYSAQIMFFASANLNPQSYTNRGYGYSVRLVRNAQ